MTAVTLVSLMNHHHINQLHLFLDILYIYIYKWIGPLGDLYFFKNYVFRSYIHVCFLLEAFVRDVLWRKQQAENMYVCKNETNNYLKNLLVGLFILKYLLFSLSGPTKKKSFTNI